MEHLTPREIEVLVQVATGDTNLEIAATLFVAEKTIRAHVSSILSKLDVHTRTEAVIAAQTLGLVASGSDLTPVAAAIAVLLRVQPDAWRELLDAGILDPERLADYMRVIRTRGVDDGTSAG